MTKVDKCLKFLPRIRWSCINRFCQIFFRFQYVLAAATSIATKVNEETLTYLNQGQSYEIKLKKLGELSAYRGKILKVSIWDDWEMLFTCRVLQFFQMGEMFHLEWCLCMNWDIAVTKWWLQPGYGQSSFPKRDKAFSFYFFYTLCSFFPLFFFELWPT